jgi:cysteine-rich repeat protein
MRQGVAIMFLRICCFVSLVSALSVVACATDDTGGGSNGTKIDAGADVDADSAIETDAGEVDASAEAGGDSGSDATTDADDAGGDAADAPGAECGNLSVEPPEECDDGNQTSGDGCSDECKLESTGPEDVCPGKTLVLTGTGSDPRVGSDSASTAGVLNQYASGCGGSGKDYVYVVTPDVTGLLTATVTSDFDAVLHARSTCADDGSELSCSDVGAVAGAETISFGVSANTPYYIFIDGYAGSDGVFTLDVLVETAFCGNGIAESPEQCDDGNSVSGDGCSPSCMLEPGGIVDDCPGSTFVLSGPPNVPRKLSLVGNTKGKATSQSPTACSGSGPNDVYGITPDIAGSMRVTMVAAYDNATLHIRSDCDTVGTQLDCIEALEPFDQLEVKVPVKPNQTFYIFADGASSSATLQNFGPYSIQIEVTPAACGNDALDGNEECDDGNSAVGDGCDASCLLEPVGTGNDVCPGAPLALTSTPQGELGVVTATTATLIGDYQAKSTTCGSKTAKDAVYSITPGISGTLSATVTGAFDTAVYIQKACGSTVDEIACSDVFDGNSSETVFGPVEANQTYFVVVDSSSTTQAGVFELQVLVLPGVCGNGILDGGEDCDDANALGGDGCDATCTLEPVGANDTCPGEVVTLVPQPSGTSTATVMSGTTNLVHDVTPSGCSGGGRDAIYSVTPTSDGVITATLPDAKMNVTLAVRTTCLDTTSQLACSNVNTGNGGETLTFPVQANQTYFVIVDSVSTTAIGTFTLSLTLSAPGCGDGLVSGGEACDDGNTQPGDGCDQTCALEPATGNDVCPGKVIPLVGTGTDTRLGIYTGTTQPLLANYAGTCGGASREAVFSVTSDVSGSLKAELLPSYEAVLFARETCNDAVSELGCDDLATTATGLYQLTFPVIANVPYYLFVDGVSGAFGTYTLKIAVEP